MVESCPYKLVKNKISSLFTSNKEKVDEKPTLFNKKEEEDLLSVKMSENRSINESCPFGYDKGKTAPNSQRSAEAKCPYKGETENTNEKKETKEEDVSDDDEPQGGCPVMNQKSIDPPIKHYEEAWDIPYFGPFDFMFELRGLLSNEEWKEKTSKLQSYNRHMLYTLFNQNDEKLNKVREKEFPLVFFIYDDIKIKGNKLFKKGKYKEALEYYCYAFSTLKWLKHKDTEKGKKFLTEPSLDPILDEEIEEKSIFLDAPDVESDSYNACIAYTLLNMSAAYMEKRNFTEALKCLNEAEEIAKDNLPDLFFRRSQVRTYNKYSTDKDLELAMIDIEKAFKSLEIYNEKNKDNFMSKNNKSVIYSEHKEKLKLIIEKREKIKLDRTVCLLKHSHDSMKIFKERKLTKENCLYISGTDQIRQMKILNEMRSKYLFAVKFFTETKNEEQLKILYKEIEGFLDNYAEFKYFIELDCLSIDPKIESRLQNEYPEIYESLEDDLFQDFVNDYKFRACEETFSNYKYNFELFKYALEKIFEDERKEREKEEMKKPKVSYFSSFKNLFTGKDSSSWIFIILTVVFFLSTAGYIGFSGFGSKPLGFK